MSNTTSDTAVATTSASVSITTITTTSISLTTSPTTTITITDTTTSVPNEPTTTPTTAPTTITSITSEPPSTTVVEPTSTTPSVINVTATTTLTPSSADVSTVVPTTPSVVVVTSTQLPTNSNTLTNTATSVSTSSRASPTPSALSASGSGSGGSGGLSSGGKIAIAVIIPIVAIAAAFLIGFFLWRKRKNRKDNEELRKNEMADYSYNPNSDNLVVGGVPYTDNASEAQDENSGYRGWGATSSNRKASTTLGSNGRAPGGPAMSESSSQPGGYTHGSPNAASDHYSADPLMNGHPEGGDGVGALGAATGLNRNRSGAAGVRRGPSNASSTYSEGHVSEMSSDNQSVPGPYYQEEVPYNIYNDAAPSHGPFGDGSYGGAGGAPVIRDVQARRNTRIERAPTFPQTQGGISQNF